MKLLDEQEGSQIPRRQCCIRYYSSFHQLWSNIDAVQSKKLEGQLKLFGTFSQGSSRQQQDHSLQYLR